MTPTLGFSVACYKGDVPLLRGCLESIRHFAPDAPICLIADGQFSTRTLERVYGVEVIRRQDVKDPGLRRLSFGFGITKLVAFWESPFDIVFHVDADAVLWGDVRKNLPSQPWDVVYNEPHEVITPYIQSWQYFNPERIFDYIEPFPWEGNPYFQAGVICVRRGSLDLDEYLRMLELQRKHPDVFFNGDQGILNILVFRAARAGRLIAREAHLQTVVPIFTRPELEKRFRVEQGQPVIEGPPTVIHWAGPKPVKDQPEVFSRPMDFFREKAMLRCGLPTVVSPQLAMSADEYFARKWPRQLRTAKRVLKKALGRAS